MVATSTTVYHSTPNMDESFEPHPSSGGGLSAAAAMASVQLLSNHFSVETISRATSPGLPFSNPDEDDKKRYRQRTFSYFRLLPFVVEDESERDTALAGILKNLYIAIKAEDFAPGALHWTRELHGWINLKFEMTRELRATLSQVYYHLALAPGLDNNTADRFTRMLITLTRYAPFRWLVCLSMPDSGLIVAGEQEETLPQAL